MKEKIKQVREIILKEIKALKNMQSKELEECKEQLIGSNKVAKEDSMQAMLSLLLEEVAGNAEEYYKYDERVSAIKLNEVRELAKLKSFSSFALVPE